MRRKFNNVPSPAFGLMFRSKKERDHCLFLESEKNAGRITKWQYEKFYNLEVNGHLVCKILPDFTVTYPDGRVSVHEIKGGNATKTDGWRIRMKLFKVLYPHIEYVLFDGRPKFTVRHDDFTEEEL